MHNARWNKIIVHLKKKYEVLEHTDPAVIEGDDAVMKEIIVVQGEKGKTRFERFTRVPVKEDPLDTSHPKDWLYSEIAVTSYVLGYRWNEETNTWDAFDVKDLFFKE